MKICIVGGTGNISTSLTHLLVDLGHEVVCFNRGQSEMPLARGVRVIKGDRHDQAAFEQAMQAERFDAAVDMICFNTAEARSSVRAFTGVKHFVFCSTACVYGNKYEWLPASEDHPLRPCSQYGLDKAAAEAAFWEAYYRDGFPMTIVRPSSTYGPRLGLLRQIAWDFTWLDRIRQGKPLIVSGDGEALHQFLHVDDAAPGFAFMLGRERCIGQAYNLVGPGYTSWVDHHRTAMRVLGREVELVGVPMSDLAAMKVPNMGILEEIYAYNTIYGNAKIERDVPEFRPNISLEEGMRRTIEAMQAAGRMPSSDENKWEDSIIAAQRRVREGVGGATT